MISPEGTVETFRNFDFNNDSNWCNPLFGTWSINTPPLIFLFFVLFLFLAPAGVSNPAGS